MNSIGILIPIMGIMCGIIAVVCGYLIKSQKMKLDMMRETRSSDAANGEVMAELHRLKDRVAVLERLMTDDDRKLAGEIERLRAEDARR
ncbi:MAG TPA: hypothetical protein PLN33_06470 [Hyphomonadaceae bacterium]|nr:hypothetical protein [Hyphomonadaceae bacterium]HPN04405.1 hypothetical protein [Hyphomonadaceae bacterium]